MRRSVLLGAAAGGFVLLVLDAIAARLGVTPGAIPTLAGPALWTTSRASGVTAFLALTLDVLFGLLVSTGAADRWIARGRSIDVHRWLSSVALALTAVHALALVGDRVVHFDLLAVIVPFLASYRPLAVGLGVLVAYGAVVVHASFGLRKRLGVKAWRRLHYLSFAVFAGALGHGVLAGSDTGRTGMQVLYAGAGAAVALLVVIRAAAALSPGRGAAASPARTTARTAPRPPG